MELRQSRNSTIIAKVRITVQCELSMNQSSQPGFFVRFQQIGVFVVYNQSSVLRNQTEECTAINCIRKCRKSKIINSLKLPSLLDIFSSIESAYRVVVLSIVSSICNVEFWQRKEPFSSGVPNEWTLTRFRRYSGNNFGLKYYFEYPF